MKNDLNKIALDGLLSLRRVPCGQGPDWRIHENRIVCEEMGNGALIARKMRKDATDKKWSDPSEITR